MWMLLPITVFRPDLAKVMLNYRIARLEEGQTRATSEGYSGERCGFQ